MHTEHISIPEYDTDDRDSIYETYMAVTNMSASALDEFQNSQCYEDYSRTQSDEGDAAGAISRNKRLQSQPQDEWTDTDFENAVTAISFIARASEQSSDQTVSAECDLSPNDCRLLAWAHDPTGDYATRDLKTNAVDVVTIHKARLTQPRTPDYEGTTPASDRQWPEGGPSLQDYIDGYGTADEQENASAVGDLSSETRSAIAQSSQLGDPSATSMEDLVVFPNVFPDTKALSEDALDSTLSTLGLASMSEETRDRVKSKTHSLLAEKFGRELENAHRSERAALYTATFGTVGGTFDAEAMDTVVSNLNALDGVTAVRTADTHDPGLHVVVDTVPMDSRRNVAADMLAAFDVADSPFSKPALRATFSPVPTGGNVDDGGEFRFVPGAETEAETSTNRDRYEAPNVNPFEIKTSPGTSLYGPPADSESSDDKSMTSNDTDATPLLSTWSDVEIVAPQFGREDGGDTDTDVSDPPTDEAGFDDLRTLSEDDLAEMGLRKWSDDTGLWLFPAEWYDAIPEGFEVTTINDETETFEPGETDDDRRFGVLPYGIVLESQDTGASGKQNADGDIIRPGTIVSWANGSETAWGKVVNVYPPGAAIPAAAITGDSGTEIEDDAAAVITVYQERDGGSTDDSGYEPKDGDVEGEERVAHKLETLAQHDSFPMSKAAGRVKAMHAAGYQHREKVSRFKAADASRRVVYGAVLVPDELDSHGDFFREETIRTLADNFMAALSDPDAEPAGDIPGLDRAGASGVMHVVWPSEHTTVVENTVLDSTQEVGAGPMARMFPRGTWLMGFKIHDDQLWNLVENGTLGGFSIGMWVTDVETYDPGALPDDVRVPAVVEQRFAETDVSIDDMETGEILAGSVHENSLVDIPSVPRAVHVAHKTAAATGWEPGSEAFERARPEQPSYALAKAAGALTESYDSCVAYLRNRGHSETAADELASYLQRAVDENGSDADVDTHAEAASESKGWVERLTSIGRSRSRSKTKTKASDHEPRSVGGLTTSSVAIERTGRTLNQRNRDIAMAMHDLGLALLDSDGLTGGRMPFNSDPEYDYETDVATLVGSARSTDTERAMANESVWFDDLFDDTDTDTDTENEESSQGLPVPADD